MYQKILVPLDGSAEAEGVLPMVREYITPESEGVLFQVVAPGKTRAFGEYTVRREATKYLRQVVSQLGEPAVRWRCEVVVAKSVAQAIVDFAVRDNVDLIAMYTHDRKGLAKLIKGSIAEKVQKSAPIDVRVIKPRELVPA